MIYGAHHASISALALFFTEYWDNKHKLVNAYANIEQI